MNSQRFAAALVATWARSTMHPRLYIVSIVAPRLYFSYAVVDDFGNLVEVRS